MSVDRDEAAELAETVRKSFGDWRFYHPESDVALARLAEQARAYDEAREIITRQHFQLWSVGLDTHEGEEPISDEDAVAALLRARREARGE